MALSPEAREELKKAVAEYDKNVSNLEAEINRANLAGIDVSEQRKRLNELKRKVGLIREQYGAELK